MSETGKKIKQILLNRNCRQKDFARHLGVSETTLSMWISGKTTPTMDNLSKLSDLLGVPLEYFVSDSPSFEQFIFDLNKRSITYDELLKIIDNLRDSQVKC